ncbi:FecCD family ABC transporter permease [Billgrantia tianxiuensis]|uniref:FecCD family ABC transporter permease n=1 Tax=Billgrantia tianxiuensis TaxID=2497861 RepID=UPI001F2C5A34|nr:iron chelate uptake ABC transporter family permease subunit [Halomonas tianxiuensis]
MSAEIAQSGFHAGEHSFYRALVLRRQLVLVALTAALLLSFCLDLALGPARFSLAEVVSALFSPDTVSQQARVILWEIRMPVALMALVVGASLSIAGAQMQTILSNPLASPFTLGISAGASFGAALALAFGVVVVPTAVEYVVPINAFVMAMVTSFLIYAMSLKRGVTIETIVLLGIAMVFIFNSLMALIQFFSSQQAVAAVVFWTMGSLTKATWPKFWIALGVLVTVLPLLARHGWALTAMRLGDAKAESMGVKPRALRLEVLVLVSLLAAIAVAFVGTIGFIGLVGPHIARMLVGEDQRFFLPGSALCGALILSIGSVLSKVIIPARSFPSASSRRWSASLLPVPDPQSQEGHMVTLQLDRLSARYGRRQILAEISTPRFEGGRVVALLGPNAAGKSTLFRRIFGCSRAAVKYASTVLPRRGRWRTCPRTLASMQCSRSTNRYYWHVCRAEP